MPDAAKSLTNSGKCEFYVHVYYCHNDTCRFAIAYQCHQSATPVPLLFTSACVFPLVGHLFQWDLQKKTTLEYKHNPNSPNVHKSLT